MSAKKKVAFIKDGHLRPQNGQSSSKPSGDGGTFRKRSLTKEAKAKWRWRQCKREQRLPHQKQVGMVKSIRKSEPRISCYGAKWESYARRLVGIGQTTTRALKNWVPEFVMALSSADRARWVLGHVGVLRIYVGAIRDLAWRNNTMPVTKTRPEVEQSRPGETGLPGEA